MNKYTRWNALLGEIPCSLWDMIKYEPEWVVSRFALMEARIKFLETKQDPTKYNEVDPNAQD